MNIGLIDLDNINKKDNIFPNIPLMKLSSYHKSKGDKVNWYNGEYCDIVYVSKVFSFTSDYPDTINAGIVKYGGSGYAIELIDGKEYYNKEKDQPLPYEIEHIYPDYSIYNITDTAYGFIQKGCPRGCDFCHVKDMQGTKPYIHARLTEFWKGQKNIVLLDPNITAISNWKEIFTELINTKANIDFSQGLDIRLMTKEKALLLKQMKIKSIHFAWDRYEDGKWIMPKLKEFKEITNYNRNKVSVYVLTNFNTTLEQDIERIMYIRSLNFQPYVMRYDKEHLKRGHLQNALARWVNFVALFWKYETFEDYLKYNRQGGKQ